MKKRYATFKARRNGKETTVKFEIKKSVIRKREEELWDYIAENHPRIFKKFIKEVENE